MDRKKVDSSDTLGPQFSLLINFTTKSWTQEKLQSESVEQIENWELKAGTIKTVCIPLPFLCSYASLALSHSIYISTVSS